MILAAEDESGNVGVLSCDCDEVGVNLVCDGVVADCDKRIKIDEFFGIEMKSLGDEVLFDGKVVLACDKKLGADKGVCGKVC